MQTSRDDIAESQRISQRADGLEEHKIGKFSYQEATRTIIYEGTNTNSLVLVTLKDLVKKGTEDSKVLSCSLDVCSTVIAVRDNIHKPTSNGSHSEIISLYNSIKSETDAICNSGCDFSLLTQSPPSEPSPSHTHSPPSGPSPVAFHTSEKGHSDFTCKSEAASPTNASGSMFPQFEQSTDTPALADQLSTYSDGVKSDALGLTGMAGNGSSECEVVESTWPVSSIHDHLSGTYEMPGEPVRSIHSQSAFTTHSSDSALDVVFDGYTNLTQDNNVGTWESKNNDQQTYTSSGCDNMATSHPVNDVPCQSNLTLGEHSQTVQGLSSYLSGAISFSSDAQEIVMNDSLAHASESFRADDALAPTSSLAPFSPAIASRLAPHPSYAKIVTNSVKYMFVKAVYHGQAETVTSSFEETFQFWSDSEAVVSNLQPFNNTQKQLSCSTAWINFVSKELAILILQELNDIMTRDILPLELTLLPLLEFIVFLQSSPRLAEGARQTIIMFLKALFQNIQVSGTSKSMVRRIRFVLDSISSITRRHEKSNSVWPWTQRSQHPYWRTLGSEWLGDLYGTLGTCIEDYFETGVLQGVLETREVLLGVTELITCLDQQTFEKLCNYHRFRLLKEFVENESLTHLLSPLRHAKAAVVFIVTVCIERINGLQSCFFLGPQSNASPYLPEVLGFSVVKEKIRAGNLTEALELLVRMDVQEMGIYCSRGISYA